VLNRPFPIEQSTVDEKDPAFARYMSNLQKAGFFGGEMQGSKGWNERMLDAKKGWLTVRNDR
jgi:hypothetical protein